MSEVTEKPLTRPQMRRAQFVEHVIRNNGVATVAGAAVGYTPRSAKEMVRFPEIRDAIATRAREVAEQEHITTREWAQNLAAIAYADPGELYDEAGKLRPIDELPLHIRLAIDTRILKKRAANGTEEVITEIKFRDKNAALVTMARHLGLFERDNRQQTPDMQLVINLVE